MSGVACVAPLFVPANRSDRFGKAAASAADAIILDLEEAVAPEDKVGARAALTTGFTAKPVIVRINAAGTRWHGDDLRAVAGLACAAVMVPKAERADVLSALALSRPIIALIETAQGIAHARAIAGTPGVGRLAFGSVDYAADLGCAHAREALASARAELVLASRLAGIPPPLDGVTLSIDDDAQAADDARYARALGLGGKMLIHPRQARGVSCGFLPSPEEVAWARQVLAAEEGGAMRVGGAMVDAPVRATAAALLARATAAGD